MAADFPDPTKVDAVAKAMAKLKSAADAAAAMEKARAAMGLMTKEAERAAAAQAKLDAANRRTEAASKRAAAQEERLAVARQKAADRSFAAAQARADKIVAAVQRERRAEQAKSERIAAAAQKQAQREKTAAERIAAAKVAKDEREAASAKRAADRVAAAQRRQAEATAKAALAASDKRIADAVKHQENLNKEYKKNAAAQAKQAEEIAKANEQFDVSAMSISGALDALKGAGPEGYAVAVALEVVTAGVVGLTAALVAMTIAAYNVIDQREDWITLFDALGRGEGAGKATLAQIDKLAKELPFATARIADWAKGLLAAGVKAEELEDAVKAVAAATALMGEEGGAAAEKMIKQLAEGGEAARKMVDGIQKGGPKTAKLLAEMGLHLEDVAAAAGMTVEQFQKASISGDQMRKAIEKALQAKGAGALANMMQDFPVILMKVKEGFLSVFEKLGKPMGKLMDAVQKFFKQFYKGSAIIQFLQGVVTKVFTVIFAYATKAINWLSGGLKNIVPAIKAIAKFLAPVVAIFVGGFKAAIAVFAVAWKMLKPIAEILKVIFTNATVLKGLQTILKLIAGAAVFVIVVFAAIAAVIATVVGVIAGFVGAVAGGVAYVTGLLADLVGSFTSAGGAITDGLLGGLDIGAFVAKMAEMAAGGLAAFKQVLGIASPSKVMAKMGENVGAGAEKGMDKSAGRVNDSAAALGEGVASSGGRGMAAGGGKGGKSITVNVHEGAVVIHAGGANVSAMDIALALEQAVAMQGLKLAGA